MAQHQPVRPSDVQALLDTVRAGSAYTDFGESPRAVEVGANGEHAVADLLREVLAQYNDATRGRDALAMALREMESRIAKLDQEAASLRTERDHLARLKGLYERKFASIRELAQQ